MNILPIYNCFHPILKEKTNPVSEYTEELDKFIKDMLTTMYNADGIGLAANQVGDGRSIFVIDEYSGSEDKSKYNPIVMINPVIEDFGEKMVPYQEGCLSIPRYSEDVIRPDEVQIKYFDRSMKEQKLAADGLLSRVIQHEYDHLEGILFYERLSSLKKALAKKSLGKIKNGKVQAHYKMINSDGSLYIPKED